MYIPPTAQSTTIASFPFATKVLQLKPKNLPGVPKPPIAVAESLFQCTEVHMVHKSPCFSAHFQPDVARVARQHGAWTEAHRLHAEGPLRQGAPRDQGPRRSLALEAHS